MFEQSILQAPRGSARGATFAVSLGSQVLVIGTALLIPMFFINGPRVSRLSALLLAPPPPPPPPNPVSKQVPVADVWQIDRSRLYAPPNIPDKVAEIVETELPPATGIVTQNGVPGGVEGGLPGGVLSDIANQVVRQPPPPPPPPKQVVKEAAPTKPTRIHTSSGVQAAKLVKRVMPIYPPLAKQARISGTVKLMGVISRDGRIMNLQVLSGHPLLVPAAVDAVRQWVYQPTLLSGEAVEVLAPIDVNFTLQ